MCSADSPGRSTLKTDAVLIFDLDGTILSVNSFPYWVRYMLAGHFGGLRRRERLALSCRTGLVIFRRKALGCSHRRAKRLLRALWLQALKKDSARLAVRGMSNVLQKHVRPNMSHVMAIVSGGHADAVLATSAAAGYAKHLGRELGFAHVIASGNVESLGEVKRDRVLALLASQGWDGRRRVFFTDHEDDLPLICRCHCVLWFGRDEDAARMQAHAPLSEVIACRGRTAEEIMRLAMRERQASSGKLTSIRRYDGRASADAPRNAHKQPDRHFGVPRCF